MVQPERAAGRYGFANRQPGADESASEPNQLAQYARLLMECLDSYREEAVQCVSKRFNESQLA